jgi:hypothetical protein
MTVTIIQLCIARLNSGILISVARCSILLIVCYVYILVLHIKRFITAEFDNVFVEFITTSECDCGAYYSGAKLVISIVMQKPRNQAGVTALAYLSYFP